MIEQDWKALAQISLPPISVCHFSTCCQRPDLSLDYDETSPELGFFRDYKLAACVRMNMFLLPCVCVCVRARVCVCCNRPVTCKDCDWIGDVERRDVLFTLILRWLSRIYNASSVIARCLWLVKFMSDIFAGWLQFSSCTAGCQSVHLFDHIFDHQPFTYILCITELQSETTNQP